MLYETEYLELIARYLNNPQDEELQREISSFRAKSIAHENYFLEIEKAWTLSAQSATLETIDVKSSANRLKKSITSLSTRNSSIRQWLGRIAAIITLALGGFWVYKSNETEAYIVKTTLQHQIDTVSLPDGSTVILAGNAGLKYVDQFNNGERNVQLIKGKAFFNIKKDAKNPFKVTLGKSEVLVVGTSFNIALTTQKIDVDVKTGKVIFSPHKDGTSSILTKGQALTYNIQQKQLTTRLAQNADAWLTKELVFVDTPLDEVCKQLSDYYHIDIKLQANKRSSKKLNATFTDQSLENVLALLNETYNIEIKKEKDQITLINP